MTGDPLRAAFTRRPGPHGGPARPALHGEAAAARWQALLEQHRHGPTAAYLHVPFCEGRCLFCMFYQAHLEPQRVGRYLRAMHRHLEQAAQWPVVSSAPIDCLYLGGGTPTALSAPDLALLLGQARQVLPLVEDAEITVEGRIHGFDDDKVSASLAAGANRFSLGVQSFDTAIRRGLGRKDDQERVMQRLEHLCAAGHPAGAAVVIDLLYGLPGQEASHWRRDLEIADALPLDGLDIYSLKLLPGSPLTRKFEVAGIDTAALYARQAELFALAVDWLAEHGWERISLSHWRRGTRERNVYNTRIHEGAHCLGFGPGAGSTLAQHACSSTRDVDAWCDAAERGGPQAESILLPSPLAALQNALRGQLECMRLDLPAVQRQAPGFDLERTLAPLLTQWQAAGLLEPCATETQGGCYRLTRAGEFWSANLTHGLTSLIAEAGNAPTAHVAAIA